jgi:hypothetical protein
LEWLSRRHCPVEIGEELAHRVGQGEDQELGRRVDGDEGAGGLGGTVSEDPGASSYVWSSTWAVIRPYNM